MIMTDTRRIDPYTTLFECDFGDGITATFRVESSYPYELNDTEPNFYTAVLESVGTPPAWMIGRIIPDCYKEIAEEVMGYDYDCEDYSSLLEGLKEDFRQYLISINLI